MREVKALWVAVVFLAACAPPLGTAADGGLAVVAGERVSASVLLGTVDRGYGTVGLAMVALLSDEDGAEWVGEVLDDEDRVLSSFSFGTGDGTHWVPSWWPTVPASLGARYTVRFFEPSGRELRVKATLAPTSGLAVPRPEVSAGSALSWSSIPGAAAYECSTQPGTAYAHVVTAGCTLPDGMAQTTTVTVRALSVDLSMPLEAAHLPGSFDVSEAEYSFGVGTSGARVRGALGSIQYTVGGAGLAALVSVQTSTGGAPSTPWDVEITGPALGSMGSLRGTQLAGTDRVVLWTYDAMPVEGVYDVRASSAGEAVAFRLRLQTASALPEVSALTAEPRGAGGAAMAWQAVSDARGYYVSVWARDTGVSLASAWVTEPHFAFSPGSFASGQACDVYVAASSADPTTGGSLPSVISLSENTFRPVSFVSN